MYSAVERNLLSLSSLGISYSGIPKPEIFIEKKIEEDVNNTIGNSGEKIAVINISAGDESRIWNNDAWSEVILFCVKKNYRVVVIAQPNDESNAQQLVSRNPQCELFSTPTIQHVVALMRRATFVVTVDTSVVHIASACNTPIVALYPNVEWNYRKFHPLSEKQAVVFSGDEKSLKGISTKEAIGKITELISLL